MDEKNENGNRKKSRKTRILALVVFVLILTFLGAFFLIKNRQQKNDHVSGENESALEENTEVKIGSDQASEEAGLENQNTNVSEVKAEAIEDKKTMVSENYRVSQVQLGIGSVSIEKGSSRNVSLEIFQVKSETIISQEDNEPRILITWKTNKEAISNVEYAKSDGKSVVNITEDGYGFEHSMLIKNMEFSTIYTYRIESTDRWGNKTNTEYFSAYTGDKTESIFDLITNAVEDVFGWAM